jgi:alpha-ketoglutaric semialdehyde dehydrogenase
MAVRVRQLIQGHWRDGGGPQAQSRNPARPAEVVADLAVATEADVDDAVRAAAAAAVQWQHTTMHERAAVLVAAAGLLDARAEQYGAELTREEGKTLAEGIGEVRRAAEIFRFSAGEAHREAGELYSSPRRGESIMVVRRPLGVVAVITPWNFPAAIPAWKIAPALVHGNAVVWKPASLVPLLAMRLAEVLTEAGLPDGVLSLIVGPGVIGTRLVEHPGVTALSFTGSTEVGTALMELCASLRKPVQAELGGKNAAVVLADADLDHAAAEVIAGAMRSTGQKCTATSRLVVDAAVEDALLDRICRLADDLEVGDGLRPGVHLGPAVSGDARGEILTAVERAVASGAEVLNGARPYTDEERTEGFFVPPTVLRLGGPDLPVWREEVFGPVLSVVRAADRADAMRLANDSAFGLSGAVFTNDLDFVLRAVAEFKVGVLHVNSETAGADPHVPFGGVKDSGYGPKEQGRAARDFYTHTTTVYLRAS